MKFLSAAFILVSGVALSLASGEIPYKTSNKAMPAGIDFNKLIPVRVGSFERVEFTPPAPGLDGEATYRFGKKEIFMLFSKADNSKDLRETMETIKDEVKDNKTTDARTISLKTDIAYIHFLGPKIAFFAWTRGLYCFSADSKNGDKKSLEEFMSAFPY